jgi:class 3 adenylate cyclase
MDDVRAVMDAAGSERAALLGVSEGGPMCMLFAATYPERAAALVLVGSFPRQRWAPDYPWGLTDEQLDVRARLTESGWGVSYSKSFLDRLAPSVAEDDATIRVYSTYFARGASPAAATTLARMNSEIDVRDVLPAIRVPTIVLYREGEYYRHAGRYLGERIPGAKTVALPGNDHLPWVGDQDALLDEVEEFVTGVRRGAEPDRVLATVLFTDIVGSTERAAALGDRRWRGLLEQHHELVRRELERFGGREVDTAGDGFLATFDGPARAIRCARSVSEAIRSLGMEIRAGVHTGECELADGRVRGIAVHTGARVAAAANPGEVLVSHTVKDLVAGSGIEFEDRGVHELKGVPGEWRLYAVSAG